MDPGVQGSREPGFHGFNGIGVQWPRCPGWCPEFNRPLCQGVQWSMFHGSRGPEVQGLNGPEEQGSKGNRSKYIMGPGVKGSKVNGSKCPRVQGLPHPSHPVND